MDTDNHGIIIEIKHEASLEECRELCDNTKECVGFTFDRTYKMNQCFIRGSIGQMSLNSDTDYYEKGKDF
jgi:hypothetical protein